MRSTAAGIAESMMLPSSIAGYGVIAVGVFALVCRNRPILDRATAAVAAAIAGNVIAISIAARRISQLPFALVMIGAAFGAIAGVTAIAIAFCHRRGDRESHPLRFGMIALLIAALVIGLYLNREVHLYMFIARGGAI